MKLSVICILAVSLLEASANFLVQISNKISLLNFLHQHPKIHEKVTSTYSFGSFQGFSGDFDQVRLKILRNSLHVTAISPDIHIRAEEVQQRAPRHLSRISRRERLPFHPIDYYYTYFGQEDVDVYIIDTGIYAEHPEFEGRVQKAVDFTGEGPGDVNGHGTHVAGIVGSKTFGAAKKVNLVEVKVLTGIGTGNLSTVIAGIEFAVNDRISRGTRKAVANLSLGATFNTVLNSAVNAAVDSGLPMVVAAGNTNSAACITSPASATNALTVGAIDDRYDTIASFSNWGSCVSVFASGVSVTSVSHLGDGNVTMSGTSMAAPAVAGTIAMFMGMGDTVETAVRKVTQLATVDAIDRRSTLVKPRSPNLIAYNGLDLNIRKEDQEEQGYELKDEDSNIIEHETEVEAEKSTTERIYSSIKKFNGRVESE